MGGDDDSNDTNCHGSWAMQLRPRRGQWFAHRSIIIVHLHAHTTTPGYDTAVALLSCARQARTAPVWDQ